MFLFFEPLTLVLCSSAHHFLLLFVHLRNCCSAALGSRKTRAEDASATRVVALRLCMKWTRRTTSFPSYLQEKQHLQHQNLDRILIFLMEKSSILPNCICFVFYSSSQCLKVLRNVSFAILPIHKLHLTNFLLFFANIFQLAVWSGIQNPVSKIESIPFLGEIRPMRLARGVFDPQSAFLC